MLRLPELLFRKQTISHIENAGQALSDGEVKRLALESELNVAVHQRYSKWPWSENAMTELLTLQRLAKHAVRIHYPTLLVER